MWNCFEGKIVKWHNPKSQLPLFSSSPVKLPLSREAIPSPLPPSLLLHPLVHNPPPAPLSSLRSEERRRPSIVAQNQLKREPISPKEKAAMAGKCKNGVGLDIASGTRENQEQEADRRLLLLLRSQLLLHRLRLVSLRQRLPCRLVWFFVLERGMLVGMSLMRYGFLPADW